MSGEIVPVNHELWMRDSDTKTCIGCEASFTTFRRRHHCRYCGLIFCNHCATKRKVMLEGRKLQRICGKCYSFLIKRITQVHTSSSIPLDSGASTPNSGLDRSYHHKVESMSSMEEETVKGRVFTYSNDIPHEAEHLRSEISKSSDWDGICVDYLQSRAKFFFESYGVRAEWIDTITNIVKDCVENVCPTVQYRGDAMNVNKYLRIQYIISKDYNYSGFLSGIAFIKNLAHRKMNKTIQNPKILLVKEIAEGSNAVEKTLVSMDKLIDQEVSLSIITLKKILSIKPSIIVCSKGLPQRFLTDLAQHNITALINVKKKLMELVARSTLGKILNSTDEIHHERNFMGECNSFYQESRGGVVLVHFSGLHDLSLAGTIFISGPDAFELASVKKIIKLLVVEYRNIKFERSFFSLYSKNVISGVFSDLLENIIVFKHLLVAENQMCLQPEVCAVEFYSEKDMALGEFLISAAEKTEQRCKECGNSWGAHSLYYIKADARIKIGFSKSNIEEKTVDIYYNRECKICGKPSKIPSLLQRGIWEYSFYKFINNFLKTTNILTGSKKCKHNFFRYSRFLFYVRGIKIIIQREDNPCYEVVPMDSKPDQTKYYAELLQRTLKELKKNGSDIVEHLLINHRELNNKVLKNLSEECRKSQEHQIEAFTIELEKTSHRLSSCMSSIEGLEVSKFSNFMEVEAARRSIFLEICGIRNSMSALLPMSKRARRKERHFLGDTVSSSGDSSGDTRKSPSPSPSFATEEECGSRSSRIQGLLRTQDRISKTEDVSMRKEFIALQRGNLTLPLGRNNFCIPVDENDLLSIIGYSINSNEYYEEVLSSMPDINDLDKIESELLSANERHFQHQFTTYEEEEFRDSMNRQASTQLYGQHLTFNVHMFFPRQFQIIRDKIGANHTEFLMGIVSSGTKMGSPGKSKATFSKSHNNLYIIKVLDEKEFGMFKDLAPNYFRHFCNSEFHSMPCRMVRTLGCYRVYTKNHTLGKSKCQWAILFENLGPTMPKEVEVYDLKGSFNHRRFINEKEKMTKMDRNFLEDFHGLPLTITREAKKLLDMSIWNDTLFLAKQNIVDYSLLLIVSTSYQVITMGIIDYIAKYTFEKALEHKYKKVISTDNPTITRPAAYKKRFRESIANIFFLELDE